MNARVEAHFSLLDGKIKDEVNKKLDAVLHTEIDTRIAKIETAYASNFARIEQLLECFQAELEAKGVLELGRFNRFRGLLLRLVSGNSQAVHAALSSLLTEITETSSYPVVFYLKELVQQLREQHRFDRRDLDELAADLSRQLEERLGLPAEGDAA
jgi:hypothetical protein